MTVSDLCQDWLSKDKKDISPGTYDNYEDIMKSMVIGFKGYDLANKQIHCLTTDMLELYLRSLAEQYSKSSIDKAWPVVKQSIEYGQKNGLVSKEIRG